MDGLQTAADLGREAIVLALKLTLPVLAAALVAGLLVAVLQAATQVQEQTLSLVTRMLAAAGALLVLLPWMLATLTEYARALIEDMTGLIR